ncbi:hypothetical protein [Dinghuibacter silviterrae]|uniref:Dolichyl-phosphate-mannose-protein mannosyltransferase n=1 Tax=Dinghuibacter silviterrae TaxID=1539049 RepID=A0A4R8DV38_9BACT|nr:hypothetical protein [Dinghuibacter silviterrae]TDX01856.1 hypothetical protein EDB95_2900 [Dinghuibacter silviterrae]
MATDQINCSSSFRDYLFKDKSNKRILIGAGIVSVVLFSIFKHFYPFASYIHGDSFVYLETAEKNLSINTYMIGYSMFLRLFSVFTTSDTALVAFQYLFLQSSTLFLLFTIFFFYKPSKVAQYILLCFMIFNPLFLYLGNLVSSDALFASLSVTWFTLLLWIIHCPSVRLIIWHTFIIFIAFTFRYNALIYLFIAIVAFFLSQQSRVLKIVGISTGAIAIGLFVWHTGNQYQKLTGIWQYSPFSGWQMANNAMYAYRYVDSAERKPVLPRFATLDNMIRTYFDSTRNTARFPSENVKASTVYMWTKHLSLFKYRDSVVFKSDTSSADELKKWATMGPLYKDYGLYIIAHYPRHFAQYFLWPNAQKYYAPPVEFLSTYNSGRANTAAIAARWFRYKNLRVSTKTGGLEIHMLDFYPILSGVTNVVMLFGLMCYFILAGFKQNTQFRKGILLGATVWLLNAGFTIFASSAALRFQVFPILLSSTFMTLLIDWLAQMASIKQNIKIPTYKSESNSVALLNS